MDFFKRCKEQYAKTIEYIKYRGIVDLLINISTSGKTFLVSQKKFSCFLKNANLVNLNKLTAEDRIGIVVTPWGGTAVPWFSITLALLYQKYGLSPFLIWDDLTVGDGEVTSLENKAIAEILNQIKDGIEIIKLSEIQSCELNYDDKDEVNRLATLIAVHDYRSSFLNDQAHAYQNMVKNSLSKNLSQVKGLFAKCKLNHLIVPGGICFNSGLYYWVGKLQGVRISSYDSGSGVMLIGTDDVAAHLMDIPKLLKQQCNIFKSQKDREKAIILARQELNRRLHGKDRFTSQNTPSSLKSLEYKYDIVIPLNIDWDSAALGKHQYFNFTHEWLTETIKFILEQTSATIAIRQHPAERHFNSGVHMERYFKQMFSSNPRCIFFPCHEKVNTYDLLNNARLVLPFTSTVGVEAAMLGKKVIVESNCYYSEAPFVEKAVSKQDYFNKIKEGLSKADNLEADIIVQAELCYYLTQVCNWLVTEFTPQPNDFDRWSNLSLDHLISTKNVQDMLKVFHEGIPLSLLASERFLSNQEGDVGNFNL